MRSQYTATSKILNCVHGLGNFFSIISQCCRDELEEVRCQEGKYKEQLMFKYNGMKTIETCLHWFILGCAAHNVCIKRNVRYVSISCLYCHDGAAREHVQGLDVTSFLKLTCNEVNDGIPV